jgi:hypothetical protein
VQINPPSSLWPPFPDDAIESFVKQLPDEVITIILRDSITLLDTKKTDVGFSQFMSSTFNLKAEDYYMKYYAILVLFEYKFRMDSFIDVVSSFERSSVFYPDTNALITFIYSRMFQSNASSPNQHYLLVFIYLLAKSLSINDHVRQSSEQNLNIIAEKYPEIGYHPCVLEHLINLVVMKVAPSSLEIFRDSLDKKNPPKPRVYDPVNGFSYNVVYINPCFDIAGVAAQKTLTFDLVERLLTNKSLYLPSFVVKFREITECITEYCSSNIHDPSSFVKLTRLVYRVISLHDNDEQVIALLGKSHEESLKKEGMESLTRSFANLANEYKPVMRTLMFPDETYIQLRLIHSLICKAADRNEETILECINDVLHRNTVPGVEYVLIVIRSLVILENRFTKK